MSSYLNRNGEYREGDYFRGYTLCLKQPDFNYVLIDNPLSDPMNCWRLKTAEEIDAEKIIQADINKVDPILKAYILCINDGSIIPGANMTGAAIKAAIKAKL